MIEVKNITKLYSGRAAVNAISFNVKEGETFVLLGTSGCGKTTTLKMLNRLIEPDEGSIQFNQQAITSLPPHELRLKIGYVIQQIGLFPHLTVKENIQVVPQLLKWKPKRITQKVEELIKQFHIEESLLNSYPNQLSGGQQQRVGLARALAADPDVILMDEPFGALDPITRQAIRKEFKELEVLKKKTIVMVTHDVEEAIELADRICLMDKGKIMQEGTVSELLFQPATDFVKRFFGQNYFFFRMQALTLAEMASEIEIETSEPITNFSALKDTYTFSEALQTLGEEGKHYAQFTETSTGKLYLTSSQKLLQTLSNGR